MLIANSCGTSGDVKIYSLDVDNQVLRNEDSDITFSDERMRCLNTPQGRECRYLCIDASDLDSLLSTGL